MINSKFKHLTRFGPVLKFNDRLGWFLLTLGFGLFVLGWYVPLPYHTLTGDDLILLHEANTGVFASSFWDSWVQTHSEKYRPVFSVIFSVLVRLFVEDYRAYFYVNLVLQLFNGVLVAYLSWLLARRSWSIAVAMGLLFLSSRFAYYYVLQLWGLMEELALFFLLMIIYTLRRAYLKKQPGALAWPLAFFFLCIFTHERFMFVAGFLSLANWFMPGAFKSFKSRLFWAGCPALVVAFNFLVKTLVIQTGFVAGRPLQTDFSSVLFQLGTGLANILGFNIGETYLSGINLTDTGLTGYLLGLGFSIPLALIVWWYLRNNRLFTRAASPGSEVIKIGLFIVLLASLLLSASIALAQEFRWLYSAYTMLLLGTAYMAGRTANLKKTGTILIGLILLGAFCNDIYYRGYLGNTYLGTFMQYVDVAKAEMIDKHGPELGNSDIFVVNWGNGDLGKWVFQDQYWFQLYSHLPDLKVHYVAGLDDIPTTVKEHQNLLVFSTGLERLNNGPLLFKDVTAPARQYLARIGAHPGNNQTYLNLISKFEDGIINSNAIVNTPTQKGVLLMNMRPGIDRPDYIGITKNLTILSSFNYRYEHLKLKRGAFLTFDAAKIYNLGDSATLYIDYRDEEGKIKRIFSQELPPQAQANSIKWESYKIPLTNDQAQEITLYFGVESPTGNSTADWVSLNHVLVYEGN